MNTPQSKLKLAYSQVQKYLHSKSESRKLLTTEEGYEKIMQILINVEQCIEEVFRQSQRVEESGQSPDTVDQKSLRLSDEQQQQILQAVVGDPRSVSELLGAFVARREELLQSDKPLHQKLKLLKIPYTEVEQVILPPEQEFHQGAGGVERSAQPPLNLKKVELFIEKVCLPLGIYADDMLAVIGSLKPTMMRPESYVVLYIPKFNKTVMINNYYGEASFIYHGHLPAECFFSYGKQSLGNQLDSVKFYQNNTTDWVNQLTQLLLSSTEQEHLDIDQLSKEYTQAQIKAYFAHPEHKKAFFALDWKGRSSFKFKKFGLQGLARVFGLDLKKNDLLKDEVFYQLLCAIYGEDDEMVQNFKEKTDPALIRKRVQEYFAQPEHKKAFFALDWKGRSSFKFEKFGLQGLARVFGLHPKKNDLVQDKGFYQLLCAIFGEDDEMVQNFKEKADPALIRKRVQEYFAHPENKKAFFALDTRGRRNFKFEKFGLQGLVRVLGLNLEQNDLLKDEGFYQLLCAIYGEDDAMVQQFKEKIDPALIRKRVQEYFAHPEHKKAFFALDTRGRKNFKFEKFGLQGLARVLGLNLEQSDLLKDEGFYQLLCAIYGEDDAMVQNFKEKADPALIRKRVQEYFAHPENKKAFFALDARGRRNFKFEKFGLQGLARVLGLNLEGHDLVQDKGFYQLLCAIFGEDDEMVQNFKEKADPALIRKRVQEYFAQPEHKKAFFALDWKGRSSFKFEKFGLQGLARVFGLHLKKNDLVQDKGFYQLLCAIFGEDDAMVQQFVIDRKLAQQYAQSSEAIDN